MMLYSDPKLLCRFLSLCGGNWHNTIYVTCGNCLYDNPCRQSDFLFLPDKKGTPVCLRAEDALVIFPERPEASECLFSLTIRQFRNMYKAYFEQLPEGMCPVQWSVKTLTDTLYNW
ncbi:MAG: hypothetical protein ACLT1I_05780 [Mediterraneibacter faecis]